MKQLETFKRLTVFALIPFIWTLAYGEPASQPDPLGLVANSKYYGRMTKAQAAEIIEKCARETYKAQVKVGESSFFMGVTPQSYPDSSGKRTTTKFKWADVKQIEVLQRSIRISYESSFFSAKKIDSFKLSGETYDLADLALAATTLTGLPLSPENKISEASDAKALKTPSVTGEQKEGSGQALGTAQVTKDGQSSSTLEERLLILKGFYDKGLITEAVYESKQKELLDSMLIKKPQKLK